MPGAVSPFSPSTRSAEAARRRGVLQFHQAQHVGVQIQRLSNLSLAVNRRVVCVAAVLVLRRSVQMGTVFGEGSGQFSGR